MASAYSSSKHLRIHVDYSARLLNGDLIIYGWIDDAEIEFEKAYLFSGTEEIHISKRDLKRTKRPDVKNAIGSKSSLLGFFLKVENNIIETFKGLGTIKIKAVGDKGQSNEAELSLENKYQEKEFRKTISHLSNAETQKLISSNKISSNKNILPSGIELFADCCLISNSRIFLLGWLIDRSSQIQELYLIDENDIVLHKESILSNCKRFIRHDVFNKFEKKGITVGYNSGFMFVDELIKEYESSKISILIKTKSGQVFIKPIESIESVSFDFKKASRTIFNYINESDPQIFDYYDKFIGPFLQSIKKPNINSSIEIKTFGKVAKDVSHSIIIPLYGRWDFLIYQLAIFSNDQEVKNQELIYVVDDPRIYSDVLNNARAAYPTYQVPFKLVTKKENLGYAGANNLGAHVAVGENLIFLNSDIIPKTKNWISKWQNIYNNLETPGILGIQLLYDDDSIQHAGMIFGRSPFMEGFWFNHHIKKGQPLVNSILKETSEIPAVTGAAMLIKKSLFDEVDGFDENYWYGDFEDSDLNLKLSELGRKNYFTPEVEMYHLERKSQSLLSEDDSWKFRITLFNAWQHTKRWDSLIQSKMEEFAYLVPEKDKR